MGIQKIYSYFQKVRGIIRPKDLFFPVAAFLVLLPSNPLKEQRSHWIEQHDSANHGEAFELMKVYSIVRDKRPDLKDSWAWEISNAVVEESGRYSLDPMLVLAVINVESSFQHGAVSTEGARGLMQVRPIVVRTLAEETNLEAWAGEKSLDDPILNIRIGVQYLHSLKRDFRDLKVALAAYNWGPTEIRNRLEEDEMLPQEYAMKVLSTYHTYRKRISAR